MHYFSDLFDKAVYMFRTDLLSIIRSLNAIGICHASLARQIPIAVYTVLTLLMMDSRSDRNIQSSLSNKSEKQFISLAFIIRKYPRFILQALFYKLLNSSKTESVSHSKSDITTVGRSVGRSVGQSVSQSVSQVSKPSH